MIGYFVLPAFLVVELMVFEKILALFDNFN